MNLLDIILQNEEYNKTHQNTNRPETILRHFRICAKHTHNVRLYEQPIEVQRFFMDTANIRNTNINVQLISELFSAFDPSHIEYIDGKKISDIIAETNIQVTNDEPYKTLSEFQINLEKVSKSISDFVSLKNIYGTKQQRINRLIENYYRHDDVEVEEHNQSINGTVKVGDPVIGEDGVVYDKARANIVNKTYEGAWLYDESESKVNEFYIIMFPEITDENMNSIKKTYDGLIIFPDEITIYSDGDKNYILNKIDTEYHKY